MVCVGLDHKKVDQLRAVTALLTSTPVDPGKHFGKIQNFKNTKYKDKKHFGQHKIPKIFGEMIAVSSIFQILPTLELYQYCLEIDVEDHLFANFAKSSYGHFVCKLTLPNTFSCKLSLWTIVLQIL